MLAAPVAGLPARPPRTAKAAHARADPRAGGPLRAPCPSGYVCLSDHRPPADAVIGSLLVATLAGIEAQLTVFHRMAVLSTRYRYGPSSTGS